MTGIVVMRQLIRDRQITIFFLDLVDFLQTKSESVMAAVTVSNVAA